MTTTTTTCQRCGETFEAEERPRGMRVDACEDCRYDEARSLAKEHLDSLNERLNSALYRTVADAVGHTGWAGDVDPPTVFALDEALERILSQLIENGLEVGMRTRREPPEDAIPVVVMDRVRTILDNHEVDQDAGALLSLEVRPASMDEHWNAGGEDANDPEFEETYIIETRSRDEDGNDHDTREVIRRTRDEYGAAQVLSLVADGVEQNR